MASLPVRWIEVRTYCHATEDEARVEAALAAVCPEGGTQREVLEGHFGNRLLLLTRRVEDRRAIQTVWDGWRRSGVDRAIRDRVDARIDDDGILHFRVDKQSAFQGTIELAKDADPIDVRLKLIAYPAKAEEARRAARSMLPEAE